MRHVSPIAVDRDRFFEDAFAPARVRQEIAASWKRSASSGVPADRFPDVRVGEIGDRARRLLQAANPVLDRLAGELEGTVTTIIISDSHARILARRDGDRGLRTSLDRVLAVPGACYGEEVVGTNGLGTAVERRRPTVVAGSEHYHEMFAPFTCVGAPLIQPLTHRFEGVLDLTCRYEDTNRLMLPMVLEAAHEITRRLYDATSRVERLLLERFLVEARRSSGPVIALSQDVIITNPAAGRLLGPTDHALLWESAARALRNGMSAEEVVLDSGVVALVRVCPVSEGGDVLGSLIELDLPPARARRRHGRSGLPDLAGGTPEWHTVCAGVHGQVGKTVGVTLIGSPGSGKLAVAEALHRLRRLHGEPVVIDAALLPAEGAPDWLARARSALATPGTLVLRHADLIPADVARALAVLVEEGHKECRRVVTAGQGWIDQTPRAMVDRFPARIVIPPLRARVADIPSLLEALSARHGANGVRWTPAAIQALSRYGWPGNVRELESLVCQVVGGGRAGDIGLQDLPPEYKAALGHRPLGKLEQIECDAIVSALDAAGGNKIGAAAALGISRSTLYRKLAAYGIELERNAF